MAKASPSRPLPQRPSSRSPPISSSIEDKLDGHIAMMNRAQSIEFGVNQTPQRPSRRTRRRSSRTTGSGGVDTGPSQSGAAAALNQLFANKSKPKLSTTNTASGRVSYEAMSKQYGFKKYEMMLRIGQSVYSAVGRMRQDGIPKDAISEFETKHSEDEQKEDKVDAASLGLREKKDIAVSKGIKMKRAHWEPTDLQMVRGSIWENLDEYNIVYDHKHFERHFSMRPRKPTARPLAVKNGRDSVPKGQIITFIPGKKQHRILIALKNLNLSNEALRQKLHAMDEQTMTGDTLSKLLEIVPTADEQAEAERRIMAEGTRNVEDYGVAEQFYFGLYDFYNLQQRLKLWMFKQNFNEITDSLQDQYGSILRACSTMTMRENKENLKLLLTIILALGNHMNSGTKKGRVHGFDLKFLTEMAAVKTFDNTRSLLMYLYEFCDRKYPNALKVVRPEMMNVVKAAASMETETLKQEFDRIKSTMNTIQDLVSADEVDNYDPEDRFPLVMAEFHKSASRRMVALKRTISNVATKSRALMREFCFGTEDSPQCIESFFGIWNRFFNDFHGSKQQLIEIEKKRQRRRNMQQRQQRRRNVHQRHGSALSQRTQTTPPPASPPPSPSPSPSPPSSPVPLDRGSSLYREFAKQQEFETKKIRLHRKLTGIVQKKTNFVKTGGSLNGQTANGTMRRLSTIYRDELGQSQRGHFEPLDIRKLALQEHEEETQIRSMSNAIHRNLPRNGYRGPLPSLPTGWCRCSANPESVKKCKHCTRSHIGY